MRECVLGGTLPWLFNILESMGLGSTPKEENLEGQGGELRREPEGTLSIRVERSKQMRGEAFMASSPTFTIMIAVFK